jgi:hypothetical protein
MRKTKAHLERYTMRVALNRNSILANPNIDVRAFLYNKKTAQPFRRKDANSKQNVGELLYKQNFTWGRGRNSACSICILA